MCGAVFLVLGVHAKSSAGETQSGFLFGEINTRWFPNALTLRFIFKSSIACVVCIVCECMCPCEYVRVTGVEVREQQWVAFLAFHLVWPWVSSLRGQQANWALRHPGILLFPLPPSSRITGMCYHGQLYVGSGEPNWSLHVNKVS